MTVFEIFQKHYQQRELAAREWKKDGGSVVAYFCDNVPEEIVLAAGFFPLRISSDPCGGTEIAEQQNIPRDMEIEESVLNMLNLVLTGRYEFADFLVVPHSRTTISKLYELLTSAKASDPTLKIPELYFFDNLGTTFYTSQVYNRERVIEFKKQLEEWSGKEISDDLLLKAIAITNENKMLLKKVAALRATEPPCISGVEALQLIGTSMFILKQEHNELLRKYLNEADNLPARKGVRLFFGGSPQDSLQFYQIAESAGATIVGEDNCWGNRYSDEPVNASINDPLEAIVDRYNRKSPCPRIFPITRRVDYFIKSAVEAKAQGVIFYNHQYDPQAWDIPDEVKGLQEKGIPSLYLKAQPYRIVDPEPIEARIKEFIGQIGNSSIV